MSEYHCIFTLRREERLGRSKLKEPFFIDSDAELFMYVIQGNRFGS